MERAYCLDIRVRRLSESYDIIPVTVSERLADCSEYKIGRYIEIDGQFRSYNAIQENGSTKLMLTVFARDVIFYDTEVRETGHQPGGTEWVHLQAADLPHNAV